MTEEIKTTEVANKTCDCKERVIAKVKEFLLIAGAVFVGGTLSILLSANLLKPKYSMGPMGPRAGIHRQLPPPPVMYGHFNRGAIDRKRCKCHHKHFKKHHRGEFRGAKMNKNFTPKTAPQS